MKNDFTPSRGETVWPILIQNRDWVIPANSRNYIRPRNEGPGRHDVYCPRTKRLEPAAAVFRTREEALDFATGTTNPAQAIA